jgi:hypothetical protein
VAKLSLVWRVDAAAVVFPRFDAAVVLGAFAGARRLRVPETTDAASSLSTSS